LKQVASSNQDAKENKRSGMILKWIAAATAVLSLFLALNQATGVLQKLRIHRKEFREAIEAGDRQQQRADYPAAFESFKHAVELDPIDREAQHREAQAAMLWLENVHAREVSFTDIANRLLPVLDKSLSQTEGSATADLLAHIGWANFLRYRDGSREGISIEETYQKALSIDSGNVYAHAMWGHWILWQHGNLQQAKEHFSAALASGRARPYVRRLQVSALHDASGPETVSELLRVADEMRKKGESLEPAQRNMLFEDIFVYNLGHHDEFINELSALKDEDVEATYDWLNSEQDGERRRLMRSFVVASLGEIAGHRDEALSRYRSLKQQLPRDEWGVLVSEVDKAIQRLSARTH
jgi:tetratricopeptide (TPR) repeat protein